MIVGTGLRSPRRRRTTRTARTGRAGSGPATRVCTPCRRYTSLRSRPFYLETASGRVPPGGRALGLCRVPRRRRGSQSRPRAQTRRQDPASRAMRIGTLLRPRRQRPLRRMAFLGNQCPSTPTAGRRCRASTVCLLLLGLGTTPPSPRLLYRRCPFHRRRHRRHRSRRIPSATTIATSKTMGQSTRTCSSTMIWRTACMVGIQTCRDIRSIPRCRQRRARRERSGH